MLAMTTKPTCVTIVHLAIVISVRMTSSWPGRPSGYVKGDFIIPGAAAQNYFCEDGDINFGFLLEMTKPNEKGDCEVYVDKPEIVFSQLAYYATREVNNKTLLPRGLKLGFVVLDSCNQNANAFYQTLSFLPSTQNSPNDNLTCTYNVSRSGVHKSFKVVAIIDNLVNDHTLLSTAAATAGKLPLISLYNSHEGLSKKRRFPFFVRFAPPSGSYEKDAIAELAKQLNWTYVSVIYEKSKPFMEYFHKLSDLFAAKVPQTCIATSQGISLDMSDSEVELVVDEFTSKTKANVVVLIGSIHMVHKLFRALASKKFHYGLPYLFISTGNWIKSAFELNITLQGYLANALFVTPMGNVGYLDDFVSWFSKRSLADTVDPWFHALWRYTYTHFYTCLNESCPIGSRGYPSLYSGVFVDVVNVLANATSRVLTSDDCVHVERSAAADCVTASRLYAELLKTNQEGYSGFVKMNTEKGYRDLNIKLMQAPDSPDPRDISVIADYDILTKTLKLIAAEHVVKKNDIIVLSNCGDPCPPHHVKDYNDSKELAGCCWICDKCNDSEVTRDSECRSCPPYEWPDPDSNFTWCKQLKPEDLDWRDPTVIMQWSLMTVFLFLLIVVTVFFIYHRNKRVIKATSIDLSMLMLLGMFLGNINMFIAVVINSKFLCSMFHILYDTSYSLRVCALFTRTLTIYRIFMHSRSRPRLRFVSQQSRVTLCLCLVIIMIGISLSDLPEFLKDQDGKSVQRYCEMPMDLKDIIERGFVALDISDLLNKVYKMTITLLCLVFAYRTRKLPDNFNESGFIFICVCAEIVSVSSISAVALGVRRKRDQQLIYTKGKAFDQLLYLSFMFFPKIYAVLFLKKSPMNQKSTRSCKSIHTLSTVQDTLTISITRSMTSGESTSSVNNRVFVEEQPKKVSSQVDYMGTSGLRSKKESIGHLGNSDTSGLSPKKVFSQVDHSETSGFRPKKVSNHLGNWDTSGLEKTTVDPDEDVGIWMGPSPNVSISNLSGNPDTSSSTDDTSSMVDSKARIHRSVSAIFFPQDSVVSENEAEPTSSLTSAVWSSMSKTAVSGRPEADTEEQD